MTVALSREQIAGMLATIAGQLANEPDKPSSADILRRLAAPFPVEAVSWRIGPTNSDKTKGKALAYIDSRDVQARLDDVLGADWQDTFEDMPGGSYCCRIGCKMDGEWRWRSDGAVMLTSSNNDDAKEMAQKGSYSDAFKRAGVKWGIGRYLYAIDAPWVDIEKRGNSVVLPAASEEKLRRWLAEWMRRNGYGAMVPPSARPAAPQPEPKKEAPKPEKHDPRCPAVACDVSDMGPCTCEFTKPAPKAPAQPAVKPAEKPAPAVAGPVTYASKPAGEPTAATLIEGLAHTDSHPAHEGLRAITRRYEGARQAIQSNTVLPDATHGKAALDAAYNAWDAWRKALWPQVPEPERDAVMKALDGWSKIAKRYDAALRKRDKERAAQAEATGANPETGELAPVGDDPDKGELRDEVA